MKRNPLIEVILTSLLNEYKEGACDNLSAEDQDNLLSQLQSLKDNLEDKQDKVYTIEEASIYLNCTRQTLRNYVKEGKLHPVKHKGGVLEFKVRELKQFKNII